MAFLFCLPKDLHQGILHDIIALSIESGRRKVSQGDKDLGFFAFKRMSEHTFHLPLFVF